MTSFPPIVFVAVFSAFSIYISTVPLFSQWAISPLIIAIVFGMFLGNIIPFSHVWKKGFQICTKHILRLGIILYGFQITLQEIFDVGMLGFFAATFIVLSTFFLALFLGKKINLDSETSALVGAGSAVCGAAAVLATEDTIHAKPEKTSVAVATVVVFGTLAMFLFPLFLQIFQPFSAEKTGIFLGATIHEVAQVVAAGNMISPQIAEIAVIVKMTRVLLLVPFLFFLGIFFAKTLQKSTKSFGKTLQKSLPWFAVFFLFVILIHSIFPLEKNVLAIIKNIDIFLLSMAMFALGLGTNIQHFKNIGGKAFLLATFLFVWLFLGGLGFVYFFG